MFYQLLLLFFCLFFKFYSLFCFEVIPLHIQNEVISYFTSDKLFVVRLKNNELWEIENLYSKNNWKFPAQVEFYQYIWNPADPNHLNHSITHSFSINPRKLQNFPFLIKNLETEQMLFCRPLSFEEFWNIVIEFGNDRYNQGLMEGIKKSK